MNKFEPRIVGFCCFYCAYGAADFAGSLRIEYPANIRIVKIPCSGRIDTLHLLKAFENGADGVFVAGCLEGTCHFLEGNYRAKKRVEYTQTLLEEIGLEKERLEMYNLSSSMGQKFAEIAREMTERIKSLGPSPVKKKGLDKE